MRFTMLAVGACVLSLISAATYGQSVEKTGLKVGAQAPTFTLKDQTGKARSLDEFLAKGKVALVFFRSASWCPFCQKQLIQLQADLKEIEAAGVQIIGISYDPVEDLAKFTEQ